MPETATPDRGGWMASLGPMAMVGGLLVLTGWTLPLALGWLLPCVVVLALVLAHELGHRRVTSVDIVAAMTGQPLSARVSLMALTLLPAAVFVTVALRSLASVLVAYPAAWWSLAGAVVFAAVAQRVRTPRVRAPIMVVGFIIVCVAGVLGTRYEASGTDARGWAHSGPIHGIHPFQSTAVIVDGYGPFDLPINDYVEPDGSRGYSPEALADAMGQAMQAIAEVHFADGPHRAHMAFAGSETGFVVDPPIRERLDKDTPTQQSPRFVVRSGTHGQRSSVEFVCPGRRDDPRGPTPDNIMNRMCPSKYSAEGSAGLGVTGRWPGYTEGRGNERMGLSRWMGWTRSDDEAGRTHVRREILYVTWGLLGLAALLVVGRRQGVAESLGALGGMTAVAVVAVVVVGVFAAQTQTIGFAPLQSVGTDPVPDAAWLPAIAVFSGAAGARWLVVGEQGEGTSTNGSWWTRLGFAAVLIATAGVAAHLAALRWVVPRLYGIDDGELALQGFVEGAANAIGPRMGLTILEIEGAVAGVVIVLLLTLSVVSVRAVAKGADVAFGAGDSKSGWKRPAVAAIVVLALVVVSLSVSRKTEGGSTLVEGALGLTLILSSSLHRLARGTSGASSGLVGRLVHLGWVAIGLWAVVDAASASPRPDHSFVIACTAAGVLTALSALVFLRNPASSGPAETDSSQG